MLKHYSFVAIAAKYGTNSHNVSFKNAVWQTFSSVCCLFVLFTVYVFIVYYCVAARWRNKGIIIIIKIRRE